MANNSINLAKHVDINALTFDGPLANNYGGKYAKVLHKGSWLLIQTPKILCPFGINVYEDTDKKTGEVLKKSYSLDVSFNGYTPIDDGDEPAKPKVKELYDLVTGMETKLVKHATENSFTWVDDEDASEPVCKALLRTCVKWSKDKETGRPNKKYAPRIKLNLPVWEDGMGFKAFLDSPENPITDMDELLKVASGKCDIVAIVKCDKVTFNGGKYGYKWNVQQLKVYSSSNSMSGYSFIEESDDEDGSGPNSSAVTETPSNMVEDSDSEEANDGSDQDELDESPSDDEEEEAVKPKTPPASKPKRRVVKRKTNN